VAGWEGNVWFVEGNAGNALCKVTPTETFSIYTAGLRTGAYPTSVTVGPDANIWFTELGVNRVGRITGAGKITNFSGFSGPRAYNLNAIASGPDGNLWVTEGKVRRLHG
jgi:streptogramin lyase